MARRRSIVYLVGVAILLFPLLSACAPGAAPRPTPTQAAAAGPTKAPEPAKPAEGTKTPASATPTAPTSVVICNTGGIGAYVRQEPKGAGIVAWPDGTKLEIVGADRSVDGEVWRNLRDERGNSGWTKSDHLCAPPVTSPSSATSAAPKPAASLQPPPTPSSSKPQSLPGLQSGDIKVNFEKRGFQCKGPDRGKTMVLWTCSQNTGTIDYRLDFMGASPTRIRSVSASILQYTAQPSDATAAEFLGFVATLNYDTNKPAEARKWVETNISKAEEGADAVFGDGKFFLYGRAGARSLDIVATGAD